MERLASLPVGAIDDLADITTGWGISMAANADLQAKGGVPGELALIRCN
jgi:hypothetical protein